MAASEELPDDEDASTEPPEDDEAPDELPGEDEAPEELPDDEEAPDEEPLDAEPSDPGPPGVVEDGLERLEQPHTISSSQNERPRTALGNRIVRRS